MSALDARPISVERPPAFPKPLEIAAVLLGVQAFWFLASSPLRVGIGLLAVMAILAANRFLLRFASAHGPRVRLRWILALAILLLIADFYIEIPATVALLCSIGVSAVLVITGRASLLAASLVGLGVILALGQITDVHFWDSAFGLAVLSVVLAWGGLRLSLKSSALQQIRSAVEPGVRSAGASASVLVAVPGLKVLLGLVCVWALMSLTTSV